MQLSCCCKASNNKHHHQNHKNDAISSKSTTTISLNTLLSTCCKLVVGTPTKKGSGASNISNISLGSTGIYGNCHMNGKINDEITSATMVTYATFTECINTRHSVSVAASRSVNPSAPGSRHVAATDPPWGSGLGGGNEFSVSQSQQWMSHDKIIVFTYR